MSKALAFKAFIVAQRVPFKCLFKAEDIAACRAGASNYGGARILEKDVPRAGAAPHMPILAPFVCEFTRSQYFTISLSRRGEEGEGREIGKEGER